VISWAGRLRKGSISQNFLLQYRSINRSGDTWDSIQHNYQQSEESYLFRVAETKHRESDTMFSAKGSWCWVPPILTKLYSDQRYGELHDGRQVGRWLPLQIDRWAGRQITSS
jgi:hypothetical protein